MPRRILRSLAQVARARDHLRLGQGAARSRIDGLVYDNGPDGDFVQFFGAARFLDLHARLGAALLDCLEAQRAERIVAAVPGAIAAPPLGLTDLTALIGRSRLSIGVDTGLAHLSVALGIPTLALYVTTDPARTGLYGTGFLRNLGGPTGAPEPREVLTIVEQALR